MITRPRSAAPVAAVVSALVLAAGCSSSEPAGEGSTTTTANTGPPVSVAAPPPGIDELAFIYDGTTGTTALNGDPLGATGSGCNPGGDELGDGIWFGTAEDFLDTALSFDLACFFVGAGADAAAAEDGTEAFDFYIRNNNDQLRFVELTGATVVHALNDDLTTRKIRFDEWPGEDNAAHGPCPSPACLVWIYVNDGVISEMVEQYVP